MMMSLVSPNDNCDGGWQPLPRLMTRQTQRIDINIAIQQGRDDDLGPSFTQQFFCKHHAQQPERDVLYDLPNRPKDTLLNVLHAFNHALES